jgi:hypothetical protein
MIDQAKALEYIRSYEAEGILTITDVGVDTITVSSTNKSMVPILDCYCEIMFETNILSSDLTEPII